MKRIIANILFLIVISPAIPVILYLKLWDFIADNRTILRKIHFSWD